MKQLLLLPILLIVCMSCDSDDVNNGYKKHSFYKNAQITINEAQEVIYAFPSEGENLVFEYTYVADEDREIADDEYSETIIFEIPTDRTTFEFTNTEVKEAKTYFRRSCFCQAVGSIQISRGVLKGIKKNDTQWEIDFEIFFMLHGEEKSRKITGIFSLEDLP